MEKELTCLDGSKIAFRLQEVPDSDELILYVDGLYRGWVNIVSSSHLRS